MGIDVTSEDLIPFSAAAIGKRFPALSASARTLDRWRAKGLETALIGGRRYTSAEAVQRFAERAESPTPARSVRTPTARRKAQAAAAAKLDALGI